MDKNEGRIGKTQLKPLPHSGLIFSSANVSLRLPKVAALGAAVGMDVRETGLSGGTMTKEPWKQRAALKKKPFIIWDIQGWRAFMINGQALALLLLREGMHEATQGKLFDWKELNHIDDETPDGIEARLEFMEQTRIPKRDKTGKPFVRPKTPEDKDGKPEEPKKDETFAPALHEIYGVLMTMISEEAKRYDDGKNILGPLKTEYRKRWSTTIRGWEFASLATGDQTYLKTCEAERDPGWFAFARDLEAPWIVGNNFGDVLEPDEETTCDYFKVLPTGHDFLAAQKGLIDLLVKEHSKSWDKYNVVARLSIHYAWERGLNPFLPCTIHTDHLRVVGPTCFPIQSLQRVGRFQDRYPLTDEKILEDSKKHNRPLYTAKEALALNQKKSRVVTDLPVDKEKKDKEEERPYNRGLVVFGKMPVNQEAWTALARANKDAKPLRPSRSSTPVSRRSTDEPGRSDSPHRRSRSLQRTASKTSLSGKETDRAAHPSTPRDASRVRSSSPHAAAKRTSPQA